MIFQVCLIIFMISYSNPLIPILLATRLLLWPVLTNHFSHTRWLYFRQRRSHMILALPSRGSLLIKHMALPCYPSCSLLLLLQPVHFSLPLCMSPSPCLCSCSFLLHCPPPAHCGLTCYQTHTSKPSSVVAFFMKPAPTPWPEVILSPALSDNFICVSLMIWIASF